MNCQEARIQAYLDGELSRDERKELARHLEHCTRCQTILAELKRLEAWTKDALHEALAPLPEDSFRVDVDAAWEAFEAKLRGREELDERASEFESANAVIAAQESNLELSDQANLSTLNCVLHTHRHVQNKPHDAADVTVPPPEHSVFGRWSLMAKAYKKWLATGAAAAVVVGALTVPQVQAATGNLLQLFRVEKVQMVQFNQQDLNDIKSFLDSGRIGQKDLSGLGKVTVTGTGQDKPTHYNSVEHAKIMGRTLPSPPSGYRIADGDWMPEHQIHLQLDVNKVNRLLQELGSNASFDERLNNQTFTITWPQIETTHYVSLAQNNSSVHLDYTTSDSPKLDVPAGVDVNQLRNTVLSLPFIPDHIRLQLESISDWQKTLPVPVVEGQDHAQTVTVNGVEGVYYTSSNDTATLVWQKGDQLHRLTLTGWKAQQGDSKQELLKAASTYK